MATTNDEQPVEREWLSVREAAKYVACGTRPIYTAIERRELKAATINGRGDLRIKREWIDAWLAGLAEVTASD